MDYEKIRFRQQEDSGIKNFISKSLNLEYTVYFRLFENFLALGFAVYNIADIFQWPILSKQIF